MRLAFAAAAFLLTTPPVAAAAVFSVDVCDDLRLVKRGADLVVVCPGPRDAVVVRDWFVMCPRTKATRTGNHVTVECIR